MPDGDLTLLIQACQKWAAVVDSEVEDTMLVGSAEGYTEDGAVGGLRQRGQVETVERREHREFELESIVLSWKERHKVVVLVLGNFDLESLERC